MELRSTRQRRERGEFRELQVTLKGLGLYEDGMNMQEMREIMEALQLSVSQNEANDMERAIRESEIDFMPMSENMLNSTMINASNVGASERAISAMPNGVHASYNRRTSSSPFSSPETIAAQLTVQAEVHHPLDWSPTVPVIALPLTEEQSSLVRKRTASATTLISTPSADSTDRDAKRLHQSDSSGSALDSGVSSALSSSFVSTSVGSSSNSVSQENHMWNSHVQASSSSVAVSDNNTSFDAPSDDSCSGSESSL